MKGAGSVSAPPFVIPNVVRNLARKKKEILRFALNDKLMVNCYAGYTESERHPLSFRT